MPDGQNTLACSTEAIRLPAGLGGSSFGRASLLVTPWTAVVAVRSGLRESSLFHVEPAEFGGLVEATHLLFDNPASGRAAAAWPLALTSSCKGDSDERFHEEGSVPNGGTPLVTAIAERAAAEAAVAGVTALAVAAAPVAALAAIGIGTFKATLFGLETLEKALKRK